MMRFTSRPVLAVFRPSRKKTKIHARFGGRITLVDMGIPSPPVLNTIPSWNRSAQSRLARAKKRVSPMSPIFRNASHLFTSIRAAIRHVPPFWLRRVLQGAAARHISSHSRSVSLWCMPVLLNQETGERSLSKLTKTEADELLAWLEVTGYQHREVHYQTGNGFVVCWKRSTPERPA
jgi:hypothetical protein